MRRIGQGHVMTDYTVKNLRDDVPNASAQFGIEGMEARFGRKALELGSFGFSYQKLTPDFRQPFGHHHREQEVEDPVPLLAATADAAPAGGGPGGHAPHPLLKDSAPVTFAARMR